MMNGILCSDANVYSQYKLVFFNLIHQCSDPSCCSNSSSSSCCCRNSSSSSCCCCCCIELEAAVVRATEERVTLLCSEIVFRANQNVGSARVPRVHSIHEF